MSDKHVCAECFEDEDLKEWIHRQGEQPGCHFCSGQDAPTAELRELCAHIESCLRKVYGFAEDQLPYESAEGGYIGRHWTTYEILVEEVQLSLPRDRKSTLLYSLLERLTDRTWCDYEWVALDRDRALELSWDDFCETVKHKRRFFFHATGKDTHDSYTPASLLEEIAGMSEQFGLVRELAGDQGTLWRARSDLAEGAASGAADFGPPPVARATQSNRMNPPGIPMLYLASSATTALREVRKPAAQVGRWVATRPLRVLDLRSLPRVPGIFSGADRDRRLLLRFLQSFAFDIMQPVERDELQHIDYLPSQVVTEFVRDYRFGRRPGEKGRLVDGIAYESTVHRGAGWNLALFLGPEELGLAPPRRGGKTEPAMGFDGAEWLVA